MTTAIDAGTVKSLAASAADRLLGHRWKVWFWGDSIGLEGLLDTHALTGDEKYLAFVRGLFAAWMAREHPRGTFDYTAPGVALLRAFETVGDPALLDAALRHASYMEAFRRTTHGAYVRYEDAAIELPPELPEDHPDFRRAGQEAIHPSGGPCVFVDSVHFDGPFFARLYRVTGEDRFRRLALENILPQIELLFDPRERLFHHFWIERRACRNGVLWGRGNGWGLLGLTSTLRCLPPDDPDAGRLVEVLRSLSARIADLQDATGGWHTVLNDPDSYVETSIAAFVVDGFSVAIGKGWLDAPTFAPVVHAAVRFLLSHLTADGVLAGVSYETFPSTRLDHYRRMPRNAMVPWGQGPLLTALRSYTEYLGVSPHTD